MRSPGSHTSAELSTRSQGWGARLLQSDTSLLGIACQPCHSPAVGLWELCASVPSTCKGGWWWSLPRRWGCRAHWEACWITTRGRTQQPMQRGLYHRLQHWILLYCAWFLICFSVNSSRTGSRPWSLLLSVHMCGMQSDTPQEWRQEWTSSIPLLWLWDPWGQDPSPTSTLEPSTR